jgi:hypothetical protein
MAELTSNIFGETAQTRTLLEMQAKGRTHMKATTVCRFLQPELNIFLHMKTQQTTLQKSYRTRYLKNHGQYNLSATVEKLREN